MTDQPSAAAILQDKLAAQAKEEQASGAMYQHYASARKSLKMTTFNGKPIRFVGSVFMTKDPEVIAYLDSEIADGLNLVTKGELMSETDSNPMERLRKKHIADFLEEQAAQAAAIAKGEVRNMGNTANASKLNVATTKEVAASKS